MNRKHYSVLMKSIHWIMALQIIALLIVGFYMADMPWGESKKTLMMFHKSFGFMAVIFIVVRIVMRLTTLQPEPRGNDIIQLMARVVSSFLYVFMVAMAFSGFFMSDFGGHQIDLFNIIKLPNIFNKNENLAINFHMIHVYVAMPLSVLIGFHFLGVFYHRFILNDDVLSRMLPRICSKKKRIN